MQEKIGNNRKEVLVCMITAEKSIDWGMVIRGGTPSINITVSAYGGLLPQYSTCYFVGRETLKDAAEIDILQLPISSQLLLSLYHARSPHYTVHRTALWVF